MRRAQGIPPRLITPKTTGGAAAGGTPPFAFALASTGSDSLADPLRSALLAQWSYGFPAVPQDLGPRLTHGFLHYPAGMQPVSAARLLGVLPGGRLLDPFVGGGSTLVEAMRTGRDAIGADASPLALFASAHHTWRATEAELDELRSQATGALLACDPGFVPGGRRGDFASADSGGPTAPLRRPGRGAGGGGGTTWRAWEPLGAEIERRTPPAGGWYSPSPRSDAGDDGDMPLRPEALSPLWFCYAAARQQSERHRRPCPLSSYDYTVDGYCASVRALREATPSRGGATARLLLADARVLSLASLGLPPADAILTSPPYAGVYDYLSHARESRAALGARCSLMGVVGVPNGRDWPESWQSENEMGARRAMKRMKGDPRAFRAAWDRDQRRWLAAARDNLRPGGRAAVMVGDGEGGIDALESTTDAAEDAGLVLLASATIRSTVRRSKCHKGSRRPEHVLLLEAP